MQPVHCCLFIALTDLVGQKISNLTYELALSPTNRRGNAVCQFVRLDTSQVIQTVMWSETVGLRTRPVSGQKIGLGLGLTGLMLCL